jgi:hypothetical protein
MPAGIIQGHQFFKTIGDALEFINKEKRLEKDVFQLYELSPVLIERVHAGSHIVKRDIPTEIEEPVFKWIQKQQSE